MWQLHDRMATAFFARNGEELATKGLYLVLPAWGYHIFDMQA